MRHPIGVVREIWRFPVKSMRGESLDAAELRWTGIAGDRQYGFVRSLNRSRFPWLTGRDLSELVLYDARYAQGSDPRNSPLAVTAPDGQSYDIWDPALAARLEAASGEPLQLLQLGRGAFDQHPVSIISSRTLVRLGERFGSALDPRRFRINIVIDSPEDAPPDEEWRGKTLSFGVGSDDAGPDGPALRIDDGISRCVMVTIDPATAERDPAIMRMVAQDFDNKVGLYGAPSVRGNIAVGDSVFLGP